MEYILRRISMMRFVLMLSGEKAENYREYVYEIYYLIDILKTKVVKDVQSRKEHIVHVLFETTETNKESIKKVISQVEDNFSTKCIKCVLTVAFPDDSSWEPSYSKVEMESY